MVFGKRIQVEDEKSENGREGPRMPLVCTGGTV